MSPLWKDSNRCRQRRGSIHSLLGLRSPVQSRAPPSYRSRTAFAFASVWAGCSSSTTAVDGVASLDLSLRRSQSLQHPSHLVRRSGKSEPAGYTTAGDHVARNRTCADFSNRGPFTDHSGNSTDRRDRLGTRRPDHQTVTRGGDHNSSSTKTRSDNPGHSASSASPPSPAANPSCGRSVIRIARPARRPNWPVDFTRGFVSPFRFQSRKVVIDRR